jgi:hypothetical protein
MFGALGTRSEAGSWTGCCITWNKMNHNSNNNSPSFTNITYARIINKKDNAMPVIGRGGP